MELRHFKCPSCGANLDVNAGSVEIKCDYCGQRFVVDNMNSRINDAINETVTDIINEKMEETYSMQPKKSQMQTALIIGVAAFVGIISLAMIILAFVSSDVLANT